jgi:hypothetical protein
MARKPKAKEDSALLKALRFIQVAQDDIGNVMQTHCRFANGFVIGFNGVIAAGHRVAEEMSVCPRTYQLIYALERAGGVHSLTLLDSKMLAIKTNKFKALITCHGDGDLTKQMPDEPRWPLTNAFKDAAMLAGTLNTDGAQTVMAASVITTADRTVIGTIGTVLIEAWHGIDMPPGLIIPKSFIVALSKVAAPITHFGYSDSSLTVWFDDNSWLRTQLYLANYPDVSRVLAHTEAARPIPLPADFFEALRAVAPFCEAGQVWCDEKSIRSHQSADKGASYDCPTITGPLSFNQKHMIALEPLIKKIDLYTNPDVICFFGDKVRGAFITMRYPKPDSNLDDEIPF